MVGGGGFRNGYNDWKVLGLKSSFILIPYFQGIQEEIEGKIERSSTGEKYEGSSSYIFYLAICTLSALSCL